MKTARAAYRDWVARRNPLAIASLALGIFSLIEFGALVVPGVAGIVLGVMALRQLVRGVEKPDGARLAWTGIVLSVISLGMAAWLYGAGPRTPTTQSTMVSHSSLRIG